MDGEFGVTRSAALIELAIVLLTIAVAWGASRIVIYPALSIPDNAPVILRPITGFFAAWILLRRHVGWASLGLVKPPHWWLALLAAVALYLSQIALSRWVVPPLALWLSPAQGPHFLEYVHGNLPALVLWLSIGWIVGGFMEECLFRGFLLGRVATLCADALPGAALGIVVQALLFGSMHLYAGTFGFASATMFALASGIVYVLSGRNLWPMIVVHGVWNTVGIWDTYTG